MQVTAPWQAEGTAAARLSRGLLMLLALLGSCILLARAFPALAASAVSVDPNVDKLEITSKVEILEGHGDQLQIEAVPGPDGVAGRISVRARTPGSKPTWMVFGLHNPSEKPRELWVTADRYELIGSGLVWPDLDARRIEALMPSVGVVPDRVTNDRADIFGITLGAGQTITFVAELASERPPRVFVWKALAYEQKSRDSRLFNGILLGIAGLLAIFLTAIFVANHKAIFPSAALVSWCVLAYLCIDFGFWHKLFQQLKPESNAQYRAIAEAAMATSIVIFLFTFLRIRHWHKIIRFLFAIWIMAQLSLVGLAVLDPRLASTFARLSFGGIGLFGSMVILWLAVRGQDRALSLLPTWLLFLVWLFGASVAISGQLAGDVVTPGLVSGLVLIVTLVGFTVTQYAFRAQGPSYDAAPGQLQLRALAVEGSGAAIWEWNARRDEISVSPIVEEGLGLTAGELSCKVDDWLGHMHPADRERFRMMLWSIQEKDGGNMRMDFRLRRTDSSYKWFELVAASAPHSDVRTLRCVGLLRDISDQKRVHERLLHDAVHDNLTGLPNRALFEDRLGQALQRARAGSGPRPTVLFIDIDRFKSVNSAFGVIVGDSLLLNSARRLTRHLGAEDTLGRVGGDQFAMLLANEMDPRDIALLAERVRRALRSPITLQGKEVVLTGSIGIAVYDPESGETTPDLLRDAEIAMHHAKRAGTDRIEIFRPEMRSEREDRLRLESDLRAAIEKKQLHILYQPIMFLPTEDLAGFEALVRWDHPKLGPLNPADFIPIAEQSDLIVKLGSYVLERAAAEAARWQKEMPRPESPLFVSVNVSTRQLFRPEFMQEVRHVLGREIVPRGALRLEITESLVMDNPEQAAEMLELLKAAGAGLSLDDFGTGYSSLAYLQRFPFDTIKIDRSLVQESGKDGFAPVVVRSIVVLAHELGKRVVAEGLETPEDVAYLRTIGCEYGQGYYFGEPATDREVIDHLRLLRKTDRSVERRWGFSLAARKGRKADGKADAKAQAEIQPNARPDAKPGAGEAARPAPQVASPAAPAPAQPIRRSPPSAAPTVPPPASPPAPPSPPVTPRAGAVVPPPVPPAARPPQPPPPPPARAAAPLPNGAHPAAPTLPAAAAITGPPRPPPVPAAPPRPVPRGLAEITAALSANGAAERMSADARPTGSPPSSNGSDSAYAASVRDLARALQAAAPNAARAAAQAEAAPKLTSKLAAVTASLSSPPPSADKKKA